MIISNVFGFQVLDSRGRPTVAASITLKDGTFHTARVPSGASTGKHEAIELRDGLGKLSNRFYGTDSVYKAIENINMKIAPRLIGNEIDLAKVDQKLKQLDSSTNFSQLGANATLSVSLASAIASAHANKLSLARYFQPSGPLLIPMPMVNILSGGAHAKSVIDFQDILIVPNGAKTFTEAISWVVAIREMATRLGSESGKVTHLIADEGGLGIPFPTIEKALEFVLSAIEKVGLLVGTQVSLAIDVAATQFFTEERYKLINPNRSYTSKQFRELILNLVSNFPIISIEDPFSEDDWEAWQFFTSAAPQKLQIIGDDLLVTNANRLARAMQERAANAILIKPNQNGLVTSTWEVLKQAQAGEFKTIVSARSGETEDSWLADLATGWRAHQIKVGSTHGGERNAKWNRLIELELIEETEFSNPFNN